MSNETKQTAVEQFSNKAYELFEQYSEGKFDRITLNKLMIEATEQAKEMEKQHEINLIKFTKEIFELGKSHFSYAIITNEDILELYNET